MQISGYLEDKIAQWIRGTAFPAVPTSLKLALSSANPTDNGSGLVEPGAAGYARQTITLYAPTTTEIDGTQTSNSIPAVFTSSGTIGSVTHAAIFDQGTNMLFYGPLDVPRVVGAGDSLSFSTNNISLVLAGRFSQYLAEAVVNWMRGTTMPVAPASVQLALSRADPLRTALGIDEPLSGQGYNRQTIAFGAPTTTPGVGTEILNTDNIVFGPDTTSDWGSISYWALFTGIGNNLCAKGPFTIPKNVAVGAGFGLKTGAVSLLIR